MMVVIVQDDGGVVRVDDQPPYLHSRDGSDLLLDHFWQLNLLSLLNLLNLLLVASLEDLAQIAQLSGCEHIRGVLQHLDVGQIDFKVLGCRLGAQRFGGDVPAEERRRRTGALQVVERGRGGFMVVLVAVEQWSGGGTAAAGGLQIGSGAMVMLGMMRMMVVMVVVLCFLEIEILGAEVASMAAGVRRRSGCHGCRGYFAASVQWTGMLLLLLLTRFRLLLGQQLSGIRCETAFG